ncbi:hypothetical protein [Gordonia neofelifaecis]|uniref:Uncharacterized protein n=1 Tax=Gordonia neofelifaecis NRRL B-59395 TaxID=644548 RepID=F1YEB2_9ACTN|nr:hypothetical protein [Gordonia neofelifaecis]EGD56745.1 hypothetical protein SCNU_00165 [Gordonia neofelifaecis NRRL B-59395]
MPRNVLSWDIPGRPHGKARRFSDSSIEKAKKAIQLRVAGFSWERIGDELGYSDPSGARHLVRRYQQQVGTELSDELRDIDLARADQMVARAQARLALAEREGVPHADWVRVFGAWLSAATFHARVAGTIDRRVEVQMSAPGSTDVDQLRDEFLQLQETTRTPATVDGELVDSTPEQTVPERCTLHQIRYCAECTRRHAQ